MGNANVDGPFLYTGFRPAFLYFHGIPGGEGIMQDTARQTYNNAPNNAANLSANWTGVENGSSVGGPTNGNNVSWLSNGFKIRS